jgi:hypothetical protein
MMTIERFSVNPHRIPDSVRVLRVDDRILNQNQDPDTSDEVPPDVLAGLARHIGYLRTAHPERLPAYRERLAATVDELRATGKAHEAPRFAVFLALLGDGAGAVAE